MNNTIAFETFERLSQNQKYVTLHQEILSDKITPILAYEALSREKDNSILLESLTLNHTKKNYSFIGLEPYALFKATSALDNKACVAVKTLMDETVTTTDDPFQSLREFYNEFRPFPSSHFDLGQMMGMLSYEAARYIEKSALKNLPVTTFPEFLFCFYQYYLVFDHHNHTLILGTVKKTGENSLKNYEEGIIQLGKLNEKLQNLSNYSAPLPKNSSSLITFTPNFEDDFYKSLVTEAQQAIEIGEVFQVVLSRVFAKTTAISPLTLYRTLRQLNPTPYLFYLNSEDFVLLGASPEKLVSLYETIVTTVPIAGTLANDSSLNEEQRSHLLKTNDKECAEHNMLVDLSRNDLGKVCIPGSVKVQDYLQSHHFSHVSHLVSTVVGQLANNYDAFDVLKAVFPAGTLTGAPKIRAMQLIAELEKRARKSYGGAICRMDPRGNFDSCITIRSALFQDNLLQIQAGAGIVKDSISQNEANETRHKATALTQALAIVEGDFHDLNNR